MFVRTCIAILVAATIAPALQAQERRAKAGDSLLVQENIFRFLFRGIDLHPYQTIQARRIIRAAYYEMRPFITRPSDIVRDSVAMVLDKRDSLLMLILPSQRERELLRLNAKENRIEYFRSSSAVP